MLGQFFDFVGIGMSQLSASSNPDRTKPRVRERIPMKPRVRTLAHPWHSACKSSNPGAFLAVSAQILEPRRVSRSWGQIFEPRRVPCAGRPNPRTLARPRHSARKSSNPGAFLAVGSQILEPRRVSRSWGPTLRTPARSLRWAP